MTKRIRINDLTDAVVKARNNRKWSQDQNVPKVVTDWRKRITDTIRKQPPANITRTSVTSDEV